MTATLGSRAWVDDGTALLLDGLDTLTEAELDGPSGLAGWSRRHLLAHVAGNAEAIGRLVAWARTGLVTPMYASPEQRLADIELGARRPGLRGRVRASALALSRAMNALPARAWAAEVVTAQGRAIPASEIPWLRARETCIHAVDLGAGVAFTDLPESFLIALLDDVAAWRSARAGPAVSLRTPDGTRVIDGSGDPRPVELSVAEAAAWLTGRRAVGEDDLPGLPRWL